MSAVHLAALLANRHIARSLVDGSPAAEAMFDWVTGLTPFAHVALVPAHAFRPGPAAIMVGLGVATAIAAIAVFRRRGLIGA